MAKVSAIYCITNLLDGKKYIGSSNNVYYRLARHKSTLKHNKHVNEHLQLAYNKYGVDAFEYSIIEKCDVEALWEREQTYIDKYGTLDPQKGYNKTNAQPFSLFTEETRKKMSEAKKGKTLSEEHKMKISEGRRGVACSEETKEKIRKKHLGKKRGPLSEEHKQKLREANERRYASQESRDKAREYALMRDYSKTKKRKKKGEI